MLRLDDQRENEANKSLPGPDALGKLIETLPKDLTSDVKRILLLDDDAGLRKGGQLAQHRPVKGQPLAELDICYDRLRSHSFKGKNRELYASGELLALICDCLYTKQSVTRHRGRLSKKEERRRAEAFARARTRADRRVARGGVRQSRRSGASVRGDRRDRHHA